MNVRIFKQSPHALLSCPQEADRGTARVQNRLVKIKQDQFREPLGIELAKVLSADPFRDQLRPRASAKQLHVQNHDIEFCGLSIAK